VINKAWQNMNFVKKGFIAKAGFTLIELLVVISIIGLLAGMAVVSFTSSQKQARDTQRKSDLKQYQTALENFANIHNSLYPSRGGPANPGWDAPASESLCADLGMTDCPEDPKFDGTYVHYDSAGLFSYRYVSDGSGNGVIDATTYVLWGMLEGSPNYWVVCSNGKVGIKSQTGWVNPQAGVCTL
jgi:prepilin-type N-terminal cleavage/methylation domain-containing protein